MNQETVWSDPKLIEILGCGGVAVMPTDTLYGLVGQALSPATVRRLKILKRRPVDKPFIVLISKLSELKLFNIEPNPVEIKFLESVWPGPVSVVLRGRACLPVGMAFRLPAPADLRQLIKATGPLAAPSANPHSLPPATTVAEAKKYFGDQVDYYADGGAVLGSPSKLLSLSPDGNTYQLR